LCRHLLFALQCWPWRASQKKYFTFGGLQTFQSSFVPATQIEPTNISSVSWWNWILVVCRVPTTTRSTDHGCDSEALPDPASPKAWHSPVAPAQSVPHECPLPMHSRQAHPWPNDGDVEQEPRRTLPIKPLIQSKGRGSTITHLDLHCSKEQGTFSGLFRRPAQHLGGSDHRCHSQHRRRAIPKRCKSVIPKTLTLSSSLGLQTTSCITLHLVPDTDSAPAHRKSLRWTSIASIAQTERQTATGTCTGMAYSVALVNMALPAMFKSPPFHFGIWSVVQVFCFACCSWLGT